MVFVDFLAKVKGLRIVEIYMRVLKVSVMQLPVFSNQTAHITDAVLVNGSSRQVFVLDVGCL